MAKYFRIADAAKDVILRQLRGSSIPRPVVRLIDAVPLGKVSPEVNEALREGAEESIKKLEDKVGLYPAVYPRRGFLPWDLVKIDDITFFLPFTLRRRVKGGVLDVADRGLKLEDANGVVVLPKKTPPQSL